MTTDSLAFDRSKIESLYSLVALGHKIRTEGISFVVDKIIPNYGGIGFLVAKAKAGKTTLGLLLIRCISTGMEFLRLRVQKRRVLALMLEDPPEYLAWLMDGAGFNGEEDVDLYATSLTLDTACMDEIEKYVKEKGIGFIYVATFLHSVRGLIKDENDNAGMVKVISDIKAFARRIGVPVLLEAHAGKNADSSPGANPVEALRGASSGGGEADYMLLLQRLGNGRSTLRQLSGLGRLVNFQPIAFDTNVKTGKVTVLGTAGGGDADFEMLHRVLTTSPQSPSALAAGVGWVQKDGDPNKHDCGRVHRALEGREGVDQVHNGKTGQAGRTTYKLHVGEEVAGDAGSGRGSEVNSVNSPETGGGGAPKGPTPTYVTSATPWEGAAPGEGKPLWSPGVEVDPGVAFSHSVHSVHFEEPPFGGPPGTSSHASLRGPQKRPGRNPFEPANFTTDEAEGRWLAELARLEDMADIRVLPEVRSSQE